MEDRVHIDYPQESESDSLSYRLVRLFEKLDRVDSIERPVLYDFIEVDSLERLISHGDADTHVEFVYCDLVIRVYGDERIEVRSSSR